MSAAGAACPAVAAASASISGVVTDRDGQPVHGLTVQVSGPGGERTTRLTDGEGRYRADDLPAGDYTVCFVPAEGQDLAHECWQDYEMGTGHTPVHVAEGEVVTGIAAVMLPPSRLRGTVTDVRGAPVAGALVSTSWRPFGEDQPTSWWSRPVVTAADGSFDTGPLPSGWYRVRFSDTTSNRYATQWWADAHTESAATWIQVDRSRTVTGIDAELADLARISGTVRGADGSPAPDARVRLYRVMPDGRTEVARVISPSIEGRYEVAVQPGTYRLAFDAAPGMFRSEYWRNARTVEAAHDVVITDTTSATGIDGVLRVAPPVDVARQPVLLGRARVGQRLTVDTGDWDVASLHFTYQWRADGTIIPNATGRRLLLTPRWRGMHIRARVTATATVRERSPGIASTQRTAAVIPTAG